MNVNLFPTKDYENVPLRRRGENKPNQTQPVVSLSNLFQTAPAISINNSSQSGKDGLQKFHRQAHYIRQTALYFCNKLIASFLYSISARLAPTVTAGRHHKSSIFDGRYLTVLRAGRLTLLLPGSYAPSNRMFAHHLFSSEVPRRLSRC